MKVIRFSSLFTDVDQKTSCCGWQFNRSCSLIFSFKSMIPTFKSILITLSIALGAACSLAASEPILEVDFNKTQPAAVRSVNALFEGELPAGLTENFTGWTKSIVHTTKMSEAGRSYLRFNVEKYDKAVQFMMPLPGVESPGFYTLEISVRARELPVHLAFRQINEPYKIFWERKIPASSDWSVKKLIIKFDPDKSDPNKPSGPLGLLLSMGEGVADLEWIKVRKLNTAEYPFTRPGKEIVNFFRNSRFPLGLQAGWNMKFPKSNSDGSSVVSDPAQPGPSGVSSLQIRTGNECQEISVYSEPFQTSDPAGTNWVSLACQGQGEWAISILDGKQELAKKKIVPTETWHREDLKFAPSLTGKSFTLKISGKGVLRIDSLQAWAGEANRAYVSAGECEVALAVVESALPDTRIQFADEKAQIKYHVTGNAVGGILKLSVFNLYGTEKKLPDVDIAKAPSGIVDFGVFPETPLGQFRIEASIEKAGHRISPFNEIVVTRMRRPVFWGADAPDSPFGSHFDSIPKTLATMKAAGVNWNRIHDAVRYTHWDVVEAKTGEWKFFDKEIASYRAAKIELLGLLGFAPAWASYFQNSGRPYFGGYDKGFQPKDLEAFSNYVKVVTGHYKKEIREYTIWNEPWVTGFFHKYWDKKNKVFLQSETPERDYTELCRLACNEAKSVDGGIKITGFNTTDVKPWTHGVLDAGGLDCCDQVDYHLYTDQITCFPGDVVEKAYNTVVGIIKKGDSTFNKPVIMSEGQGDSEGWKGWAANGRDNAGIYKRSMPWASEDDFTAIADKCCRFEISHLALGIQKIFVYTSDNYKYLGGQCDFLTLLGADGYPHPALSAHSQMAWELEGRKFVKRVQVAERVWAYLFEGRGVTVAVISGKEGGRYQTPASPDLVVTDLYGNPSNGDYRETVLYVDSKRSPDKVEELLAVK